MKRTGQSKIAVVGWGRGMGHKGHMYLADAVIQQASDMKADPYFFVSKTVGKDDPLMPEEKVKIYQKVFPQQATIFTPESNLNHALEQLAQLGYQGVVLVVGADQKQAFQYLEKPNKEGVPVFQSMGLKKLKVISRQETRSKFAHEEGPRATPMREILLDPNASEEDRFKVWRRDMPEVLGDDMVADLMHKAESRLVQSNAPKNKLKAMSKKVAKLKESINRLKQKKLDEARIIDANAKVNLYYVTRSGQRQIVFQNIPQRMLDKAIMVLRSKYPQIKDTDIEMRPANPESMVDEGISLNALSKFANIIPSFTEKLVKAGAQESKETWQMLQILKLKMQGKATPEQVQWMNKQWRDLAIIAVGVGLVGHAAVAGAAAHGVAAGISHGAKDALLHSLGDIGLEAAAEVLATKFGIDIVKKLSHSLTTSTGQGHEHEQEKAPQQYGVSPAVAAKNQQDLERKFQQAKMGFGGMSESEDYLEE